MLYRCLCVIMFTFCTRFLFCSQMNSQRWDFKGQCFLIGWMYVNPDPADESRITGSQESGRILVNISYPVGWRVGGRGGGGGTLTSLIVISDLSGEKTDLAVSGKVAMKTRLKSLGLSSTCVFDNWQFMIVRCCSSLQHRMWKVPPEGHRGWKWSRWEPPDLPVHSFTAAAPSQRQDFVSHRSLD